MILSVHIHKETGKAFVTDLENGNTWSKENLEMVINFVEEHNAHSILGGQLHSNNGCICSNHCR